MLSNLLRHGGGRIGLLFLGLLSLAAVLAPLVAPYDPLEQNLELRQAAPSFAHFAGTDELGRDLLSRAIFAARVSLITGLGAASLAASIGIPLGLAAGELRGWFDGVVTRTLDFMLSIPAALLALTVIVLLGASVVSMVVAITIVNIPAFARLSRASTLELREAEYVLAERSMGEHRLATLVRTILPNSSGPLLVQFAVTAATAMLLEAGLSFLGLGVSPPTPSWGGMIQTGRSYLLEAPWYALVPGVLLSCTILSFDAIGRGLRSTVGRDQPKLELQRGA